MATTITLPSLTDNLVAKIQSRVATFLLCREKLTKLTHNVNIKIVGSATKLLATQTELETKLSSVLSEINNLQTGVGTWNFNDITKIGTFYYALERHIKGTRELEGQAGEVIVSNTPPTGGGLWVWISLGLFIYLVIRR